MAASAGLRNVPVHEYLAIDLHLVSGAAAAALKHHDDHAAEVARALG